MNDRRSTNSWSLQLNYRQFSSAEKTFPSATYLLLAPLFIRLLFVPPNCQLLFSQLLRQIKNKSTSIYAREKVR